MNAITVNEIELSPDAARAFDEYGYYACIEAYRLNVDDGEGGWHIHYATGIDYNDTSAAIQAGGELCGHPGW